MAVERETKAQRVERIKREKNPWDLLPDIQRWATTGFDSIPPEDLDVRLRAWGIYTQGDGAGVRGKHVPYFMLRIRIANGALFAHQMRVIAQLAARYARGVADITDRQNIQLHWIRTEDIPEILERLQQVGLTSLGACGDVVRNVTGCPLAGIDHEELVDASPLVYEVNRLLNGNREFSNLPRKFKITVSGCKHWCTNPEINDVGFTAVRRGDEVGFHVQVGGGLSSRPFMAVKLNAFVPWHRVLPVAKAIAEIFRDSDVLRENRAKARLKFMFLDLGWDADAFLAEVEKRAGFKLDPAVPEEVPNDTYRDHVGVHPQAQPDLYYAGFTVPTGRISAEQLEAFAGLAEQFGQGRLRTTLMQNIVVLDIPAARLTEFRAAAAVALPFFALDEASVFHRGVLACTGSEFCKLALTETKAFGSKLADELQERLPHFNRHLKINLTGCPNSCGQHWISDVGLMGIQVKGDDGSLVDGYEFFLGGGLGAHASFGRRVAFKVRANDVAEALARLIQAFEETGENSESFREWAVRQNEEQLAGYLRTVAARAAD